MDFLWEDITFFVDDAQSTWFQVNTFSHSQSIFFGIIFKSCLQAHQTNKKINYTLIHPSSETDPSFLL